MGFSQKRDAQALTHIRLGDLMLIGDEAPDRLPIGQIGPVEPLLSQGQRVAVLVELRLGGKLIGGELLGSVI